MIYVTELIFAPKHKQWSYFGASYVVLFQTEFEETFHNFIHSN